MRGATEVRETPFELLHFRFENESAMRHRTLDGHFKPFVQPTPLGLEVDKGDRAIHG